MAVEYDDGTPAAAGIAQATQDMAIVNEPTELESDLAAATMDGPASAAAQTLNLEPDTIVPGSAARASNKNVSFNLLQQQQQMGYTAHDADSDDDDDDDVGGGDGDVTSSVRVAVRIRPFLPSETGTSGVIDVLPSTESAGVATTATGGRHKRKRRQEAIPTSLQIGGPAGAQFTYDAVHGTKSTQADLYLDTVRPLVRQCLKGCELHMVFVMFMAMHMLLLHVSYYIHVFFGITNNVIIFLTVQCTVGMHCCNRQRNGAGIRPNRIRENLHNSWTRGRRRGWRRLQYHH